MDSPDVLLVGGKPVTVGAIVHVTAAKWPLSVPPELLPCRPLLVQSATDEGAIDATDLSHIGGSHRYAPDDSYTPGTWHHPDPNRRQCQGRA